MNDLVNAGWNLIFGWLILAAVLSWITFKLRRNFSHEVLVPISILVLWFSVNVVQWLIGFAFQFDISKYWYGVFQAFLVAMLSLFLVSLVKFRQQEFTEIDTPIRKTNTLSDLFVHLVGPVLLVIVIVKSIYVSEISRLESIFAWTMGGDSRNHLGWIEKFSSQGGVTWQDHVLYPVGALGLVSFPVAIDKREIGLLASLEHFTISWIIGFFLVVYLLDKIFTQIAGKSFSTLPFRASISLVALSSYFFSYSQRDGFMPAIWALIPLLIALLICNDRKWTKAHLPYLFFALILQIQTWALLVPIQFVLVMYALARNQQQEVMWLKQNPKRALMLSLLGLTLLALGFGLLGTSTGYADNPGGITPISAGFVILVFVMILIATFSAVLKYRFADSNKTKFKMLEVPAKSLMYASIALVAVQIWLATAQPAFTFQSYYGIKLFWLFSLPVLILSVAILLKLSQALEVKFFRYAIGLIFATGFVVSLQWATNLWNAKQLFETNSFQPNSVMAANIASLPQRSDGYVYWNFLDGGNDRLGNFWVALLEAEVVPNALYKWAYDSNQVDSQQLCNILSVNEKRLVITSDSKTSLDQINSTCPEFKEVKFAVLDPYSVSLDLRDFLLGYQD